MDAVKEDQVKAHALALAELLYGDTDPEQVKTLAEFKSPFATTY